MQGKASRAYPSRSAVRSGDDFAALIYKLLYEQARSAVALFQIRNLLRPKSSGESHDDRLRQSTYRGTLYKLAVQSIDLLQIFTGFLELRAQRRVQKHFLFDHFLNERRVLTRVQ